MPTPVPPNLFSTTAHLLGTTHQTAHCISGTHFIDKTYVGLMMYMYMSAFNAKKQQQMHKHDVEQKDPSGTVVRDRGTRRSWLSNKQRQRPPLAYMSLRNHNPQMNFTVKKHHLYENRSKFNAKPPHTRIQCSKPF